VSRYGIYVVILQRVGYDCDWSGCSYTGLFGPVQEGKEQL